MISSCFFWPELKTGEASKFHRQWEGPYKIVKQVTEVTFVVEKVDGRSGKSKVVHFNNLRLYERKTSEGVSEGATTDAVRSSEGDEAVVMEGECEHEPQVQDSDVLEDNEFSAVIQMFCSLVWWKEMQVVVQCDTGGDRVWMNMLKELTLSHQ